MAEHPVYLEIEEQIDSMIVVGVVGRSYDQSGDTPRDESIGQIVIAIGKDDLGIEVRRNDEAWTGPVAVTVR